MNATTPPARTEIDPKVDPVSPHAAGDSFWQSFRDNWVWFAAAAATLVLLYFLGPIMTPFVVGATLAYLGSPVVDRLNRYMPRTLAVLLVFVVFFGVVVTGLVIGLPLLEEQAVQVVQNIPDWLRWVQDVGLQKVGIKLPPGVRLDAGSLRNAVSHNWSQTGDLLSVVLARIGESTPALLGFLADLLLIPIVTFYLLRDWDKLVIQIDRLVPPRLRPHTESFAGEIDSVLSALIRGQLLVMAALAVVYGGGLWIAGLHVALLVGILAGLVSFIPYLGFASGFVIASIAMVVQTQTAFPLVWVALVFGVGLVLENAVLTPLLVGERIGLHPVAVIFALLAGGELFGFSGVLAALPVAAVLAVGLRRARKRWIQSPLYWGGRKARPVIEPALAEPLPAPAAEPAATPVPPT